MAETYIKKEFNDLSELILSDPVPSQSLFSTSPRRANASAFAECCLEQVLHVASCVAIEFVLISCVRLKL